MSKKFKVLNTIIDYDTLLKMYPKITFPNEDIIKQSDLPTEITLYDKSKMTLDELKTAKKAEVAAARYEYEVSGININGIIIRTDRESQALITGAALEATQDSEYSLTWKAANGFAVLKAAQIIYIAKQVRSHVENAFIREAQIVKEIDSAASPSELECVDTSFK
jgi:hypothetical protein